MMVGLVAAALVVLILLLVLNGDGPPSMRKVEAAKTYAIELAYGFEDNKPPAAFTFTTAR